MIRALNPLPAGIPTGSIADKAVTYAKLQDVGINSLLGRDGTPGSAIEIPTNAIGRQWLIAASIAAQRTLLGLGTAALSATTDFEPAGAAAGGDLAGNFPNPTIKDRAYATKAADYTALLTDGTIKASATCIITLPDATTCAGKAYLIGNTAAAWSSIVTVKSNGGTIDGAAAGTGKKVWRLDDYVFQSDGTNWIAVQRPPRRRRIFAQLAQISHTGDTAETLAVAATIPAGMLQVGSLIDINGVWSAGANNANAKTPRIRDGASTIWYSATLTSVSSVALKKNFIIRDATHAISMAAATADFGGTGSGIASITCDITLDVVLSWNLLNSGSSGDTSSLEYGTIDITDPA